MVMSLGRVELNHSIVEPGVELQSGLPQQTMTSGYDTAYVAGQVEVELQYVAPQQTTTYEYGVGGVQQEGMQGNGYTAGQGGVELQYDAPQPTEEVVAVERNLAFGVPQQGVELNYGLPQQTIAPEYGVGSIQQNSMQYNQYVTGQGGAELQYAAPQQTTNYEYSVPMTVAPQQERIVKEVVARERNLVFGAPQQGAELPCGVPQQTMMPQYGAGSGQQKSMQYSGSVAGQGGVGLQYGAPQQTTNYTYGVPSTVAPQQGVLQQRTMPQYGVGSVQQKSMQRNGSVAGQGGVDVQYGASQQTTKYEYGAGGGPQGGMQYSVGQRGMQHSGSVTGQGGVGLQYGAPQQTTKSLAVAPQKEPQQGVKLQYGAPEQTTKYEYGVPMVQPIGQPAQGGRIVSENRSLPTETVLAEVPTPVAETAAVTEVGPVTACSISYSTAPQKNVTITGPPWMIRASVAPPPVLAVKVQPQH